MRALLLLACLAARADAAGTAPVPTSPGMGPLPAALKEARVEHFPDSCWVGLDYAWETTSFTPTGRREDYRTDHLEFFTFRFESASQPAGRFDVSFQDGNEITYLVRGRHETRLLPRLSERRVRCLAGVAVDLPRALKLARDAGLAIDGKASVFADLAYLPKGYAGQDCRMKLSGGSTTPCPRRSAAKAKAAEGREAWAVSTLGSTVWLDAGTGAVLAQASLE